MDMAGTATSTGRIPRKITTTSKMTKTNININIINKTIGDTIMLNIKIVSWAAGTFTAVSFIFCVIYGLVTPESIHMHQFLEIVLPAFEWLSVGSFFLGLIESFAWGAYIGLVYVPIYNFFYKRWGSVTA
jgi:hypothetical protein